MGLLNREIEFRRLVTLQHKKKKKTGMNKFLVFLLLTNYLSCVLRLGLVVIVVVVVVLVGVGRITLGSPWAWLIARRKKLLTQ